MTQQNKEPLHPHEPAYYADLRDGGLHPPEPRPALGFADWCIIVSCLVALAFTVGTLV